MAAIHTLVMTGASRGIGRIAAEHLLRCDPAVHLVAAIYLVHEFARRLAEGIDIVSFNPGSVPGTGLARNADPISQFRMARIMPLTVLTPMAASQKDAGRNLANTVLGKTKAPTGSYVDRRRSTGPPPNPTNAAAKPTSGISPRSSQRSDPYIVRRQCRNEQLALNDALDYPVTTTPLTQPLSRCTQAKSRMMRATRSSSSPCGHHVLVAAGG